MQLHDATNALCGDMKLELYNSLSITQKASGSTARSKHWTLAIIKRKEKRSMTKQPKGPQYPRQEYNDALYMREKEGQHGRCGEQRTFILGFEIQSIQCSGSMGEIGGISRHRFPTAELPARKDSWSEISPMESTPPSKPTPSPSPSFDRRPRKKPNQMRIQFNSIPRLVYPLMKALFGKCQFLAGIHAAVKPTSSPGRIGFCRTRSGFRMWPG